MIRPLRGQFFYRRGDPSTLWRLYHLYEHRPIYGLVKIFTVLVVRPLCGQFFYRRGGPSTLDMFFVAYPYPCEKLSCL